MCLIIHFYFFFCELLFLSFPNVLLCWPMEQDKNTTVLKCLSTDKNKNTVQIAKNDQTSPSPREQEGLLLLYQLQLQLHSVSLTSQIKIKISNHRIAPISDRLSANVTQAQITEQSPLNPVLRKCPTGCPWCAVFLVAVSIRLNSACLLLCFLVLLAGGHKHVDVHCCHA